MKRHDHRLKADCLTRRAQRAQRKIAPSRPLRPWREAIGLVSFVVCCAWPMLVRAKPPTPADVKVFPPEVNLKTQQDRQSIVVQAIYPDGVTRDVTTQASY